jgi:TolB-like protein
MRRVCLFVAVLALLLGACVPQMQIVTGPSVAVINAPTDFRVEGLADKLQTELQRSSAPNVYSFVSRSRVAFQETHRDMAGSRARLQAAFIARTFGAEYAVIVAAPVFEREIKEFVFAQTIRREVSTEVQLEARIIDPVTAEVLSTYTSGVYKGFRVEIFNTDEEIIEESKDPDLNAGIGRALNEIAPGLATDLELLFSRQVAAK